MIDFDSFVEWAESRFDSVVVSGDEVRINSIFTDDDNHHLWCNPFGGKHEREDGCYRCWKTDRRGTLIGLVMRVEGCGLQEARRILAGATPIHILEQRVARMFEEEDQAPQEKTLAGLPPDTFLIESLGEPHRSRALRYLADRRIPIDGLYFCTGGKYRDRVVIPYHDRQGRLIYFNARHIGKSPLRYRGPEKAVGVGKADVLYFPAWPPPGEKVYLTEGEFDAITLRLCGFWGAACGGKNLSEKQMLILRGHPVCLCPDNDRAGVDAVQEMAKKLGAFGVGPISYVRPPQGFKDWNKLLISCKAEIVAAYVKKNEAFFGALEEGRLIAP